MQKEADQCGVESKVIPPRNPSWDCVALSEATGLEARITISSLPGDSHGYFPYYILADGEIFILKTQH